MALGASWSRGEGPGGWSVASPEKGSRSEAGCPVRLDLGHAPGPGDMSAISGGAALAVSGAWAGRTSRLPNFGGLPHENLCTAT